MNIHALILFLRFGRQGEHPFLQLLNSEGFSLTNVPAVSADNAQCCPKSRNAVTKRSRRTSTLNSYDGTFGYCAHSIMALVIDLCKALRSVPPPQSPKGGAVPCSTARAAPQERLRTVHDVPRQQYARLVGFKHLTGVFLLPPAASPLTMGREEGRFSSFCLTQATTYSRLLQVNASLLSRNSASTAI